MTRNPRVKVYSFRKYDIVSDCFISSRRMATRASIERIRAVPIKGTEIEINRSELNRDGMTKVGYYEIKMFNGGPYSERLPGHPIDADGHGDAAPSLGDAIKRAKIDLDYHRDGH